MNNFWSNYYSIYGFNKLNIFNELEKALNLGNDLIALKLIKELNKNESVMEIIEKLENKDIFKADIVIECLKHNCNFTKEYLLNELQHLFSEIQNEEEAVFLIKNVGEYSFKNYDLSCIRSHISEFDINWSNL